MTVCCEPMGPIGDSAAEINLLEVLSTSNNWNSNSRPRRAPDESASSPLAPDKILRTGHWKLNVGYREERKPAVQRLQT
jgi:hypothetical protein